jgi:Cytochrome c, mono- and diheme variants
MKYLKIIAVLSFTAFFAFACAQQQAKRAGIVISESKSYEASLYRQNCAVCHGKEADGKESDGQKIPSLRYGDIRNKSEEEIYEQIANGKLPMPSFKNQLTDEEIRRMVRFIRKDLQGRD